MQVGALLDGCSVHFKRRSGSTNRIKHNHKLRHHPELLEDTLVEEDLMGMWLGPHSLDYRLGQDWRIGYSWYADEGALG